jgi:2-alkenal reductase
LIIILFMALFVGIGGGALAGGAAGYYLAQSQLATSSTTDQQVVTQMVDAALEEASLPTAAPQAAPLGQSSGSAANGGNLSELMVSAVQKVSPAVVTVINRNGGESGSGSGVIISQDGYIITNHHVVEGSDTLSVLFADSTLHDAQLIGSDELSDIAVIKVDSQVPAVATIGDSTQLEPGEQLLAIGSPLGNFRNTVTAGVVSALNRSVGNLEGLIQTDASINRGNSGGPLINLNGEVVGINTLVVRGASVFGGDQAEGLGFAVPSTIFNNVSRQLIENGEMKYPYLGIFYRMIDGQVAAAEGLPVQNGALVSDVSPGTPAAEAGLQSGDIIIAVDGMSLGFQNTLRYVLTQYQPGDTVQLTIRRGDEELQLPLTLGTRPPEEDLQQQPEEQP